MSTENVHRVCLQNEYNFVRETMESKDVEDGVRLISGKRAGSQTVEGVAYEFNPAKFSLGTALSWMETRGLDYGEVRMAQPVAKFRGAMKRFWFEACAPGAWKAEDDGTGKPGKASITKALLQKAVDWIQSGKRAALKYLHDDDQKTAYDLCGPDGMGQVVGARLNGDVLELEAEMPERSAHLVEHDYFQQPSVEINPKTGALYACAFLGFSPPAVKGLASLNAKLAAPSPSFAAPAFRMSEDGVLLLLAEADTDPGSPDATGGENSTGAGTTPAPNPTDSHKETVMSDDLKPALLKMAAGRIDDALGRAVAERRIEPGQVESEKESLSKLAEATYTNPDILDSSIKAMLARPQMADRTKAKADPTAADTSGALDALDKSKEDKRPATAKLAAIAQKYVDDKVVQDFKAGWERAASENPAMYKEHDKASYKLRGANDEEVAA